MDIHRAIARWANSNGLVATDVSKEIENYWDTPVCGLWQTTLMERALANTNSVYFAITVVDNDGSCNLEGMYTLRKIIDLSLRIDQGGQTYGSFHFVAWRKDDFVFGCDIKTESQVHMGLEPLLSTECPVCLEPLNELQSGDSGHASACFFICSHQFHFKCGLCLKECPICRETTKAYSYTTSVRQVHEH